MIAAARHCEGFAWQENGLRHSFISYRLAVLHDTARVALEAGNPPEVIFGHYRELVTPETVFNLRKKGLRGRSPARSQALSLNPNPPRAVGTAAP